MLTQIPAGYISDRMGGIMVATYAASVWVPLTLALPLLTAFAPSSSATLWLIVFYRLVLGALQGFYYPCIASALSKRVDKAERAFSYAFCASGTQFGLVFKTCSKI
jgi:MFS family permease